MLDFPTADSPSITSLWELLFAILKDYKVLYKQPKTVHIVGNNDNMNKPTSNNQAERRSEKQQFRWQNIKPPKGTDRCVKTDGTNGSG
ncbi:unnamed protein product [Schistosoma curassoni]|uniref:Retrovirus-related Pol polyprotein from transposon TNT 1-94 n=1 Tax=Schistosoma curassoni TaxID=6186 RepID=A0A183KWQ6_9TREM|nr:unnamed protein product [Schistosoma curassoni]